jgi:hypothetical protein
MIPTAFIQPFIHMLLLMVFVHFLADFPLQGPFLSEAKNPNKEIPGVPWWIAMAAHCAIHAGFVWIITGSYLCCAAEFLLHFETDWAKCEGKHTFLKDQVIHLVSKLIYAAFACSLGTVPLWRM